VFVALRWLQSISVLVLFCQGCSSWKWYFPYHYAPFASDFVNISDVKNEFESDTKPFKPLEQLMGVFPAASRYEMFYKTLLPTLAYLVRNLDIRKQAKKRFSFDIQSNSVITFVLFVIAGIRYNRVG
jgi:hypothetical protein